MFNGVAGLKMFASITLEAIAAPRAVLPARHEEKTSVGAIHFNVVITASFQINYS